MRHVIAVLCVFSAGYVLMLPGFLNGGLLGQAVATGGGGEHAFSDVKFLTSFDGADAAKVATDDSNSGHAITFNSVGQLDTAQKKFGTASFLGNGSQGIIMLPANHADFHFLDQPFNIDIYVRFNINLTTVPGTIFGLWDTNGQLSWSINKLVSPLRLQFLASADGATADAVVSEEVSLSTGQFYHFRANRDASSVVRLFMDGTMLGKATYASSLHESTGRPSIFGQTSNSVASGAYVSGWADEPRIIKGFSLNSTDDSFTVPTEAWPRS